MTMFSQVLIVAEVNIELFWNQNWVRVQVVGGKIESECTLYTVHFTHFVSKKC